MLKLKMLPRFKIFKYSWVAVIIMMTSVATARADNWYPSQYGAEDEKGAAQNIKPEDVLTAAKLIKTGKIYSLGIETNSNTPAFPPRTFNVTILQPGQVGGKVLGNNKTTYNDDIINGWLGMGSQIDGLGHLGIDNVYYNGNKAENFVTTTGLTKLGVEKIPPIVTRGVLLDMTTYFDGEIVKEGTAFNQKEIEAVAQQQQVTINKNDVVLFHTGWLNLIGKDNERFKQGEPGLGVEGAKYLVEKGVVAIGADTWGLEVLPFANQDTVFEVHQTLLAKNGVYILENIDSRELAKDKVYEFMFVLGTPKITGAVQMIVNPIAIH